MYHQLRGARLLLLSGLIAAAPCGCSEDAEEPEALDVKEAIQITLGPSGTITASGIIPGCEEFTPTGEFSATFYALLYDEAIHGEKVGLRYDPLNEESVVLLGQMSRVGLQDGGLVTLMMEASFKALEGREVCILSRSVIEHDSLYNDRLMKGGATKAPPTVAQH